MDPRKDLLYQKAKLRCLALINYGKQDEDIISEMKDSFWPEHVVDQLIEELDDLRKLKISLKGSVKIPTF